MAKRTALAALAIGSPLLLLSLLLGGKVGEWLFALTSVAFPVLLIAAGASRAGRLGRVAIALVALGVLLEAATIAILLLSGRPVSERTVLGLPPSTALMLLGMGLLPLILVSWAYAATFDAGPSDGSRR